MFPGDFGTAAGAGIVAIKLPNTCSELVQYSSFLGISDPAIHGPGLWEIGQNAPGQGLDGRSACRFRGYQRYRRAPRGCIREIFY